MICTSPIETKEGYTVRCGQCMSCRINRKTEWKTKLYLEYLETGKAVFITLTYAPEFYPEDGSLQKHELQRFIKRYREHTDRNRLVDVRYFGVGEYGTKTQRAHYHVIIFGHTVQTAKAIVKKAWKLGHSEIRDIVGDKDRIEGKKTKGVINSINYTIGYTIKKLTSPKDFKDGRQPEFSIMSRKPALGTYGLGILAKHLKKYGLYPLKVLDSEMKFYLRELDIDVKDWNGIFYVDNLASIHFPNIEKIENLFRNDKHKRKRLQEYMQHYGTRLRLDRNMMKKLGDIIDPDISQKLEGMKPLLKNKNFRKFEERSKHEGLIRNLKDKEEGLIEESLNIGRKLEKRFQEQKEYDAIDMEKMPKLFLKKFKEFEDESYIEQMLEDRRRSKEIIAERKAKAEERKINQKRGLI